MCVCRGDFGLRWYAIPLASVASQSSELAYDLWILLVFWPPVEVREQQHHIVYQVPSHRFTVKTFDLTKRHGSLIAEETASMLINTTSQS